MKSTLITIPNALSVSRIVFLPLLYAFALLEMRLAFLVLYTLVGSTDALDGFIARRFNMVSEFGKTIDSVADILFYVSTAAFLYILYPNLILDNIVLVVSFFALFIFSFMLSGYLLKKPIMMHTMMLRYTAVLVYVLVVFSYFMDTTTFLSVILILYLIGFIEECFIFIFYGDVDRDTKSIVHLMRKTSS